MASALQLGILCLAFWTAVLGFRSRRTRGVGAGRFVSGLGLGAAFAHGGWLLLHADQVAQHPELIGNPALGRSVLFFPLGLLALTPVRASTAARRAWLDASFAALPPALSVARLGCLIAGCCGGLPIGGEFFLKRHPTPLYEMGGLWLLGLAIRGCPAGLVAPVALAGFGAVRAAVDPLRAPPPLGSPLLPPSLLALAWLGVGATLGLRPLREALFAPSSRGPRNRGAPGVAPEEFGMTPRKPAGIKFRDWVESHIQRAKLEGAFDDLPGEGRPFENLEGPYDPLWWAKDLVRRENLSLLPESLEIRRKVEQFFDALPRFRCESEIRESAIALDREIRRINARVTRGPASSQAPLDVEAVVARWHQARESERSES